MQFKEVQCELENFEKSVIKVIQGIIIFGNFLEDITHNCNKSTITQRRIFLLKFKNCEFTIFNKTYSNVNIKVYDTFVLLNLITKIRETNVTK